MRKKDKFHPLYREKQEVTVIDGGFIDENNQIINLDNTKEASKLAQNITQPTAIRFKYDGEIATGVVIPSRHPAAVQYLRDVADYNDISADIKRQMELSRKLYIWEGIIGTVIDMFCDFATTDIKIENIKDKRGQEIIEYFLREVNSGYNNITTGAISLSHMMSFCYFVDGNVFPYNKWFKTQYGKKASQNAKLPMLIVPINPLIIDIPEDTIDFGSKRIRIDLSRYYAGKTSRQLAELSNDKMIPLRVRRSLQEKQKHVELEDGEIYHIKRRGTTFGAWGVPYLTRAFSAVASKRKLRVLDDSTTDGMVNMITIFKVGDPDVPATLNPSRITKLQSLLANPTSSLMLAWSYDIDILQVGPKGEILDFADKYKQVNYDILAALGVPGSLLTGQGDGSKDIFVLMMVLMERLEECRHEIREYFRYMISRILIENGIHGEVPRLRTPSNKIRKDDFKTQILNLWDRGLLSYDTALEEGGYDFEAELRKKQLENQSKISEVFTRPSLPFDSPNNKPSDRKNVDEKERVLDRKTTKMKNDNTNADLYINFLYDLQWMKSRFSDFTKTNGINYAANWYYSKMKSVAKTLNENKYGIDGANKLLLLAITSGNTITIINAINNLEKECIYAITNIIGSGT